MSQHFYEPSKNDIIYVSEPEEGAIGRLLLRVSVHIFFFFWTGNYLNICFEGVEKKCFDVGTVGK